MSDNPFLEVFGEQFQQNKKVWSVAEKNNIFATMSLHWSLFNGKVGKSCHIKENFTYDIWHLFMGSGLQIKDLYIHITSKKKKSLRTYFVGNLFSPDKKNTF